jgi:hypothetical protein
MATATSKATVVTGGVRVLLRRARWPRQQDRAVHLGLAALAIFASTVHLAKLSKNASRAVQKLQMSTVGAARSSPAPRAFRRPSIPTFRRERDPRQRGFEGIARGGRCAARTCRPDREREKEEERRQVRARAV